MNFSFYQKITSHGSLGYKALNEYEKELSERRSRKEEIGGL